MKLFLRLSAILLASIAIVLSGCAKKPRPNPSQTVMGPGPGQLNPQGVGDLFAGDNPGGLEARDLASMQEGERGILPSVLFDFDSAAIRASERPKLTQAADYLKANAGARVRLEGHCDWRGTTEYNMGLGDRRASAARDFLVSLGISRDRLETLSKGDLDAKEGATEAEAQQDRRVDLVVLR